MGPDAMILVFWMLSFSIYQMSEWIQLKQYLSVLEWTEEIGAWQAKMNIDFKAWSIWSL